MYSSIKDHELIQLLQKGDALSFSKIYQLYKDKVFSYAFVHTGSRETAEEIMQDVFLRLWEKRHKVSIDYSFSGYVRKVAFNRVNDFFRNERTERHMQANYVYLKEGEQLQVEEAYIGKELFIYYREAISRLPAQRKLVFILNREYGLSYKQIAQKMGISLFTVRNQLVESVKFIRNYLASCCN